MIYNLIMYILPFYFFYRLLVVTFLFGWGDGVGYRHGWDDCGRG